MKPTDKTPSELIDHIADLIKERESKELPTYYTISIEQYEKNTPVAEKEAGYENFKKQVQKYITDYQLTSITVQLYSGKSRNVKHPFQVFKVSLTKQPAPTVILGGSMEREASTDIQQLDSSIPVGRYYDEKFELQMRIMRTEMEKQNLVERLTYITERYEDKLKEQETRSAEKLKVYEDEIEDLEEQIEDLEKEIAKGEKDKHNSLGNVALGSIGARIVENFAKSDMGTGVLKGLLGAEGYTTLQGHLAGIEQSNANTEAPKETARIISTPVNDPRQNTLAFIQQVCEGLPDSHLRMLYDICQMSQQNIGDLQVLWNVSQQIINQRKQSVTDNNTSNQDKTGDSDEDTDENEIDTSKIE